MIRNILTVCAANICRSPMAQGLIGQRLWETGTEGLKVQSAGLNALVGYPVEGTALRLMQEQGVDLSSHRARQLDRELLLWADLILVMEKEQKRILNLITPSARGKTYRVGEWSDADVFDPYGQPVEAFRSALRLIDNGVCEWLKRLNRRYKMRKNSIVLETSAKVSEASPDLRSRGASRETYQLDRRATNEHAT